MLASKTIMYESFRHNKIIFDKKDKIISPSRFYNKQKKLVKMVPALSYKKIRLILNILNLLMKN